MEKTKKRLLALIPAIFALSVMLASIPIQPLKYAYAVQAVTNADVVLAAAKNEPPAFLDGGTNSASYFFTASQAATATSQKVSWVRSDLGVRNPTQGFITIKPVIGGCALYSTCSPTVGTGYCASSSPCANPIQSQAVANWKFTLGGMACGITECWTQLMTTNSTYPNQMQGFSVVNGTFGNVINVLNLTNTQSYLTPNLWVVETSTGGLGGINIFSIRSVGGAGGTDAIYKSGGSTMVSDVNSLSVNGGQTNPPQFITGCWHCGGNITRNIILSTYGTAGGGTTFIEISSGTTNTHITSCGTATVNCTNPTGGSGSNSFTSSGAIAVDNTFANGTLTFIVGGSNDIDKVVLTPQNTFSSFSVGSTLAHSGLTANVRGVVSSCMGYCYSGQTDTFTNDGSDYIYNAAQITRINDTFSNFGTPVNFDSVSGLNTISGQTGTPSLTGNLAIDYRHSSTIQVDDSQNARILYLTNFKAGVGGVGTTSSQQQTYINVLGQTCIDIYDATGTIKLTTFCSNSNSGGKIATNTLRLVNTGANVSNTGFTLGCGIGFISCTNQNAQTNGVGLILLGLLILISYGFVVFLHYQVKTQLLHQNVILQEIMYVNPFVLIVMVFTDVAIMWQVKLVPDLYFYSIVVLIAGFTAFGVYRHIR